MHPGGTRDLDKKSVVVKTIDPGLRRYGFPNGLVPGIPQMLIFQMKKNIPLFQRLLEDLAELLRDVASCLKSFFSNFLSPECIGCLNNL
jgi:hypothetical protein